MRIARLGCAAGVAAVACLSSVNVIHAQSRASRAPEIRLTSALGSVGTNYIQPLIRLSEDAYVFAISVDVDHNIQVLHPDFPGISVKLTSRKQLHLPSFFAGYSERRSTGGLLGNVSSSYDYYDPGYSDSRGTVIALASRKPFDLEAVTSGGSWDVVTLRRIVDGRDPLTAASELARYLGAEDEPIGRDVHRFAGTPHYYSAGYNYYNRALYDCLYFGHWGYSRGFSSFQAAQLRAAGHTVRYLGLDACGEPRYVVSGQGFAQPPGGRPPATGAFPRSRIPVGVPRNPSKDEIIAARRAGRSPTAERYPDRPVTTAPPRGRTTEPRSGVERSHPRPAAGALPDRPRVPERISPPHRADIPERQSAPPPQRVEQPMPAPETRSKPVEVKPVDQ